MHILELNFEKYWRGGERQTIYNIRGFLSAGHEVVLLCRKGSPLAEKAKAEGITVEALNGVLEVMGFLISSAKKFDVLHCQTSNLLTYCVLTKWLHKKPVVLSRRVSYVPKGYFTLLKYRLTNRIVAISKTVQHILESQGIKNVSVIGDIAIPSNLNAKRSLDFISSYNPYGKKIIITMAAFEPEKDPVTMVKAIKLLSATRNDFLFFHFGIGSMFNNIKEMINSYELENIYYTPGFVEESRDFLSVADVFAFSSEQEGLGSSILDAFLAKVPVASTDGGGLKDLVTPERGMICAVKDATTLSQNINRLLDDEQLKNNVVENAFNYVTKHHGMQKITAEYLALFEQVL